ncbi:MAG: hypothetical protein MKZ70_01640, partial [Opitutales bacterium]|nr:hypothetical protein [Opitutales bacterium]
MPLLNPAGNNFHQAVHLGTRRWSTIRSRSELLNNLSRSSRIERLIADNRLPARCGPFIVEGPLDLYFMNTNVRHPAMLDSNDHEVLFQVGFGDRRIRVLDHNLRYSPETGSDIHCSVNVVEARRESPIQPAARRLPLWSIVGKIEESELRLEGLGH